MPLTDDPVLPQYLNRHQDTAVTREHFSFSPRMPVGDFYEERDSTEVCEFIVFADRSFIINTYSNNSMHSVSVIS